jgi:hypothetical protein
MSNKILFREWVGVALVVGVITTTLIVSKISERRVNKILETALKEMGDSPIDSPCANPPGFPDSKARSIEKRSLSSVLKKKKIPSKNRHKSSSL